MYLLLIVYCILVALSSAFGGALSLFIRFTHRRVQLTLSFVSGVMLGVALLHLLPHAATVLNDFSNASLACLTGLLVMFFLIRMFDFHHHDFETDGSAHSHAHVRHHDHDHQHGHQCQHEPPQSAELTPQAVVQLSNHSHNIGKADTLDPAEPLATSSLEFSVGKRPADLSWVGLSLGLALHTLLDGIALAAAVQIEGSAVWLAGLGTFLAIVLHKPLDAFSITSLMAARGWGINRQMLVNIVFAAMCPLGALLFAVTVDQFADMRSVILGSALAFSAGVFLCISLGDLLPEVHFHSHDRGWLSVMLIAGVALAYAIEWLPGHTH